MLCHVGSCFFFIFILFSFCLLFLTFSDVFNTRWSLWNQSLPKWPLVPFAVSSLISGGRIVLTVQCLMVIRMLLAILGPR